MNGFDPITRLATREAIRFVGTVGDVQKDILPILTAVTEAFRSKEIRSAADLTELVRDATELHSGKRCQPVVARNTLEVASAMRVLMPIPQGPSAIRKYTLGDNGRVIKAIVAHPRWTDRSASLVFRRPMFESNGDYLLQAMHAIQHTHDREAELEVFTDGIRRLPDSKLSELPIQRQGVDWDVYLQELRGRQAAINAELGHPPAEVTAKPTIASLQRERRLRSLAATQPQAHQNPDAGLTDSKTYLHHLSRCRSWLTDLELFGKQRTSTRLTVEGERILRYFQEHSMRGDPIRIPPTADLLKDVFRLSEETICRAWGVIVDDAFWEQGLFDLGRFGEYHPAPAEFLEVVEWAFAQVKISQVSEAALSPLRQVIFLGFLLNEKPISSTELTDLIQQLFERRGDIYGLGRNRQGRPAFVFRKRNTA